MSDADLSDTTFVIDTLKKITNVINKQSASTALKMLRALTGRGATVILLGHCNKYKDEHKYPVYEGTGDVRSDVDELALLHGMTRDYGVVTTSLYWKEQGWESGKSRAMVQPISWQIDVEDNRKVTVLDDWVDTVEESKVKREAQRTADVIRGIYFLLIKNSAMNQSNIIKNLNGIHGQRVIKRIAYTAKAGTLLMHDEEGKAIAEFGYTSYTKKDSDPARRPIMFAWNGGPGSASMWLHMGVLGPQITVVEDLQVNGKGPFKRSDNPHSIIDKVDLVMVDPVGTGYSRAVGEAEDEDFWGVDNDIKSVSDFIAQFITMNNRWASPKYILGESYGGMRAGGVSLDLLTRHNIGLNGVILVSPYMDVAGGGGAGVANMAVGYTMTLSGYAATAWFHDALENKPSDFQAFLAEVDAFAISEYLSMLVKGARAPDSERRAVAEKLGAYTGTSADYWLAANLRVKEGQFVQELLRKRGQLAGRVDSRFAGFTTNALAEDMPFDPYTSAVGPAFVSTFNDYYRRDLGVEIDRKYVVSGQLYKNWDRSHVQPGSERPSAVADTGIDLAHAIIRNPDMKVLVQQGYFDLATPYRATEYFIDQMPLPESLRSNVSIKYYQAGHMMYVHPPSLLKFREDLASFIDGSQ